MLVILLSGIEVPLMLARLIEPADGRQDQGLHRIRWLVEKKTLPINSLDKHMFAIVVGAQIYQLSFEHRLSTAVSSCDDFTYITPLWKTWARIIIQNSPPAIRTVYSVDL